MCVCVCFCNTNNRVCLGMMHNEVKTDGETKANGVEYEQVKHRFTMSGKVELNFGVA